MVTAHLHTNSCRFVLACISSRNTLGAMMKKILVYPLHTLIATRASIHDTLMHIRTRTRTQTRAYATLYRSVFSPPHTCKSIYSSQQQARKKIASGIWVEREREIAENVPIPGQNIFHFPFTSASLLPFLLLIMCLVSRISIVCLTPILVPHFQGGRLFGHLCCNDYPRRLPQKEEKVIPLTGM